jgi:hypothetical protein
MLYVKKIGNLIKAKFSPSTDVDFAWDFDVDGLQVTYIEKDTGFGSAGEIQVGTFDGDDLYTGKDFNKAAKIIKQNI